MTGDRTPARLQGRGAGLAGDTRRLRHHRGQAVPGVSCALRSRGRRSGLLRCAAFADRDCEHRRRSQDVTEGFNIDQYKACEALRERTATATRKAGTRPAACEHHRTKAASHHGRPRPGSMDRDEASGGAGAVRVVAPVRQRAAGRMQPATRCPAACTRACASPGTPTSRRSCRLDSQQWVSLPPRAPGAAEAFRPGLHLPRRRPVAPPDIARSGARRAGRRRPRPARGTSWRDPPCEVPRTWRCRQSAAAANPAPAPRSSQRCRRRMSHCADPV